MTVLQLKQPSRLVPMGKGLVAQRHSRDSYSDERDTVKSLSQELQDLQRKLATAREQSEFLRKTAINLEHSTAHNTVADQQRRLNLHRTRMALTAHERQLFEELRELRLRTAAETSERMLRQRHASDSGKTMEQSVVERVWTAPKDLTMRNKAHRSVESSVVNATGRLANLPSKAAMHRSAPARREPANVSHALPPSLSLSVHSHLLTFFGFYTEFRDHTDDAAQMMGYPDRSRAGQPNWQLMPLRPLSNKFRINSFSFQPDVRVGLSPELNIKVPPDSST
ncbi:hypothetical protein Ciccas_012313 [Cichlidogyrus casuarinus]|uniref:Uncharacterized protein n=1 Tax=Cichlidogyrus casuarinus TaxID=1844966 RepID=A0ABD2PQI8_9PLAT